MSRMYGTICNEPKRLVEALEPVRDQLMVPGTTHGWGLGYVHAGEVLLQRNPRRTDDLDVYEALRSVSSDYVIVHASNDETYAGTENTQPFRYRRWLYAQTGVLDDFEAVRPAMLGEIPEFLRRSIRGKTPAECMFHVFLAQLHIAGVVDNHKLSLSESRRALRDALALIEAHVAKAGGSRGPGNVIVTNSRTMLAVRIDAPLHVRRFKDIGKRDGEDFRAVLIASGLEQAGEGFEALPPRSVIMVSRDLQIDIVDLGA